MAQALTARIQDAGTEVVKAKARALVAGSGSQPTAWEPRLHAADGCGIPGAAPGAHSDAPVIICRPWRLDALPGWGALCQRGQVSMHSRLAPFLS